MSIFLHFLNREIYRSVGSHDHDGFPEKAIRILIAGTNRRLFSNYSNLLEGVGSIVPGSILNLLLETEQLNVVGERASLDEFIASREPRYRFDQGRYPMYFEGAPTVLSHGPHLLKKGSSTAYIENGIRTLSQEGVISGVLQRDIKPLNAMLPRLIDKLNRREQEALTISYFGDQLRGVEEELPTARLLSSLYIRQYMEELNADIATGFRSLVAFDHLANGYPSLHLPYLAKVMEATGISVDPPYSVSNEAIVMARSSYSHFLYSEEIGNILATLSTIAKRSERGLKGLVERFVGVFLSTAVESSNPFDVALHRLSAGVMENKRQWREFESEYEEGMSKDSQRNVILLVTATDRETQALNEVYQDLAGEPIFRYSSHDAYVAKEYQGFSGYKLIHVQCEAGSTGPSNSQAVITDAIQDFAPDFVIMGGIAFGLKRDKQKLGDVLVSTMVHDYERVRKEEGRSIPRGQRIGCSAKLVSAFRAGNAEGLSPVKAHFGLVLSGEKLSDSQELVDELLNREPEAIGGEMEGAGLVSAAHRKKVDWILIKSVVDWGYNKAQNNDGVDQLTAAKNAYTFILKTLQVIGV